MLNRRELIASVIGAVGAACLPEESWEDASWRVMQVGVRSGMSAAGLPFVAPGVRGMIVFKASGHILDPGLLVRISKERKDGSLPWCLGYANDFHECHGVVLADGPVHPGTAFAMAVEGPVNIKGPRHR